MSFSIYGESQDYIHLVSAPTREKAVHLFIADIQGVDVPLHHVLNIYAVEGNKEDPELEEFVQEMIKKKTT